MAICIYLDEMLKSRKMTSKELCGYIGITEANLSILRSGKAKGVRFGRPAKPLPDKFDEMHQAWRDGQMTLRQAANACGMPESSFYQAAVREKGQKGQPV